jgi:hypothetical protein
VLSYRVANGFTTLFITSTMVVFVCISFGVTLACGELITFSSLLVFSTISLGLSLLLLPFLYLLGLFHSLSILDKASI